MRVALAALVTVLLASRGIARADICYIYDDPGRLTGVADAQGNVAIYAYDAVGNLLSIQRINAGPNPVQITWVAPSRGLTGGSTTIVGKGFIADPAANTVRFNGTLATVTSATANCLVASVPAGATTGGITVTNTLGSATSPSNFTVGGTVTVSPTTATLYVGGTQAFQAFEGGTPTANVTWAVNGITGGGATVGTISTDGLYATPVTVPSTTTVTVTATHRDDRTSAASATVTIIAPYLATATGPRGGVSVTLATSQAVDRNVQASASITPRPVITGVQPATAPRGGPLTLTLNGAGFQGASQAFSFLLNNSPDGAITVSGPIQVNGAGTQATVPITITSGAALGGRVVLMTITTPNGTSTRAGTGGNVFTVTGP